VFSRRESTVPPPVELLRLSSPIVQLRWQTFAVLFLLMDTNVRDVSSYLTPIVVSQMLQSWLVALEN
jgi:hypothetical protein